MTSDSRFKRRAWGFQTHFRSDYQKMSSTGVVPAQTVVLLSNDKKECLAVAEVKDGCQRVRKVPGPGGQGTTKAVTKRKEAVELKLIIKDVLLPPGFHLGHVWLSSCMDEPIVWDKNLVQDIEQVSISR